MKRMIALLLTCLLTVAVFGGCGTAEKPEDSTGGNAAAVEHSLRVGFGRVDISPEIAVPLGGGSQAVSYGVIDPLYATCIAVTDEADNTVLFYHLDLLFSYGDVVMQRRGISKATGVEPMQIMFTATHNHSGPDLSKANDSSIQIYCETLPDKIIKAATDAMADRKPVTGMYITRTYPENVNFLRHHILADGSKTGWATPAVQSGVAHLFDADNEMQLVKFVRDGGKDILLMNWQAHPRAPKDTIRSDVDAIRRVIEPALDCQFAYFLGAAGNVNSGTYIKADKEVPGYTDDYVERGKILAQYAIDAVPTFQEVKVGEVKLNNSKLTARMKTGTGTMEVPLYAFSFGDVAFMTAPYEMFTENGLKVKEESPFAMTFVASCANGAMGYIPSDYAYEYDCYEVSSTAFGKGTAEELVAAHIALLKQLYENN